MNGLEDGFKSRWADANGGLGKADIAAIILAIPLACILMFSMGELRELQIDQNRHEADAVEVNDGIGVCAELELLVFNLDVSRNPEKIKADWVATKRKLLDAVGNSLAFAEADDRQRMAVAERALHTFIVLFERRMSMRIGDTASRKERDALEASLEEQAGKLTGLLSDQQSALCKKAREADEAYESKFTSILWLAAGLVLLEALLIFSGGRELREITRLLRQGAAMPGEG